MNVSLASGENRYENVKRALLLIKPDLEAIRTKKRILIKPNLTSTEIEYANTHPDAVRAVIDFLLENFDELRKSHFVIFEGSGSAHDQKKTTREVFERFAYYELAKNYRNVSIECIEDFSEFEEIEFMSAVGPVKAGVVKRFFDFDYRISIAIPKMHNSSIVTGGIKNMAGLIRQEDKTRLHGFILRPPQTKIQRQALLFIKRRMPRLLNVIFRKEYLEIARLIHRNIVALAKVTWPDLVVLDAFCAMEGNGPVQGAPVSLQSAVCSVDPVKADSTGVRLMGLRPEQVGYLYYLQQQERGDTSLEGLIGDDIAQVWRQFKLPTTYNVQKHWRDLL